MFTLIVCKYLTKQLSDPAGKAFMVIFTIIADALLIICILESILEIFA